MAEVFIPPWLQPVSPLEIKPIDDMTSIFQPRFARGRTQRQVWGDPRWGVTVKYQGLRGEERAAMNRVVEEAIGRSGTIRMTPGMPFRGSFPVTEVMSQGTFVNSINGWVPSGAQVEITADERVLRITRISSYNNAIYTSGPFAVTSGAAYVARAFFTEGPQNPGYYHGLRLTDTSFILYNETSALASRGSSAIVRTSAVVTSGNTLWPMYINYNVPGAGDAGTFFESPWMSLARCARVYSYDLNTNGQMLLVDLPSSATNLARVGDWVEINGELKRVTMPLNSNVSGTGWLHFRPRMANVPNHADPVIFSNPYGKFMLAGDPRITENFGVYTDYELDLIEVYE